MLGYLLLSDAALGLMERVSAGAGERVSDEIETKYCLV